MRRALSFVVFSTAVVVSTAAHVGAAPSTPTPTPTAGPGAPPRLNIDLPALITDARRTPHPKAARHPPYSAGQIYYDVQIKNPSSKPLVTEFTAERPVGGSFSLIAKLPVNIPPNESAWITYVDPAGLGRGSCAPSTQRLTLGTGATKKLVATPSCTFTSNVVDPTAPIPPDTKQAQRANKIYHTTPTLSKPAPTACEEPISVTATLVNSSSVNASHPRLKLDLPEEGSAGPMSQSPDLAAGKTGGPLTVGYGFSAGIPGKYTLVVDGGGAPTWQQGWSITIARACQIDVSVAAWQAN